MATITPVNVVPTSYVIASRTTGTDHWFRACGSWPTIEDALPYFNQMRADESYWGMDLSIMPDRNPF